jgi:hypothetical protein
VIGVLSTLFLLYGLIVAAAAMAARFLRSPIPRRWLLVLALPPLLFFWQGFLLGKTPLPADQAYVTTPSPAAARTNAWSNDVASQFAPWAQAVHLAWQRGEPPHRNRWNGCGMALAANGQSAAYAPLTLAGMLLPIPAAFTLWAAARLFLALCGAWLWLGQLGVSRRASLLGAIAFSFSLSMTAWLNFPHTAVLCLWPWILWSIERLRQPAVSNRALALLAALFFLVPLAGHAETAASLGAFTVLWLAVRWAAGDRERAGAVLLRIAAAALLALGLSAFSLIPQALAILDSNRLVLMERPFWTPILSFRPHGPAWPTGLLMTLFPRVLGDKITASMLPGAAGSFPEMVLGYFGILGAAAAALIARPGSRRPAAEWALLAPLLFGLGAATGCWPFAEIASSLPALKHMFPLRYLTWAALAGSALAAFELDRLGADLERKRGAALWTMATLGAGLLAAALTYRHFAPRYAAAGSLAPERNAYLLAGAALAAGIVVVAATGRKAERFAAIGIPLWTLIAGAELYRQGLRLNRMSDAALVYPSTPLAAFLRAQPGPFRVAGEGVEIYPNVGVFAGFEDVRTHDPAERRDYVEFLEATCGYDPASYFKWLGDVNAPALDFLNVRYLVCGRDRGAPSEKWKPVYSGADGTVFENRRVRPRVFAPERLRILRHPATGALLAPAGRAYGKPYRELFAGLDWSTEAVVLDDGRGDFRPSSDGAGRSVGVTEYRETGNAVSFLANVSAGPGQAILVTSLASDGGWRAFDGGDAPLPVGRANGPFLALALPAGAHRVRLEYRPPGWRLGAWISLGSLAVAAAAVVAARRRRGA